MLVAAGGAAPCGPTSRPQPRSSSTVVPPQRQTVAAAVHDSRPGPHPAPPWTISFDIRERETEWTDANKARLVALVAAQRLSLPMAEMEERLDHLTRLLPDLAGRMNSLHPSLVAGLAGDMAQTSSRLLALRELLPAANVSAMVSARPQLLLQDPGELQAAVASLAQQLHVERVDRLVEAQPLLLVPECVASVLAELQRLLPNTDAAALLVSDPSWLLRAQHGQRWLGLHPDSEPGEQIDWRAPGVGDAD